MTLEFNLLNSHIHDVTKNAFNFAEGAKELSNLSYNFSMKNLQTILLVLAGLYVSMLLLTINVVYIAAFKPSEEPPPRSPATNPAPSPSGSAVSPPTTAHQQQQIPSFSSPITPPVQQQQSPIIPGVIPTQPEEEQQQPEPIVPGGTQEQQPDKVTPLGPVQGFKATGTVNSVISTPSIRWIATGNWSMFAGNGNIISFITNMTWYNNNGTGSHTHEFLKFVPTGGNVTLGSDNSLHLNGLIDVGTDRRAVWKNVHSLIDIKGGRTLTISVDDKETNNHFAGQPIYGVVTSLIRCSDEPGPNMEVLPPCTPPSA